MTLLRLATSLPTALALTVASSSLLTAQIAQEPILVPSQHEIGWPVGLGFGTIRRVEGLLWDSDKRIAAIGVRGVSTAKATAPAITPYIAAESFGASIVDLVKLPLAGDVGSGKDGLLLSTINGSSDVKFAYTDANGAVVITDVAHTGWNRAGSMQAALAVGGVDVAAISFSGTTVLRTYFDYQTRTFTQLPDLVLTQTIHDVCIVDFDVDGSNDVAVLTDTGMFVYDVGGTQLHSESVFFPGGAIEEVPQAADRSPIAFLRHPQAGAGNDWELLHVSQAGTDITAVTVNNVANFTLQHMESGDIDFDQDFDILIQATGNESALLENDTVEGPNFTGAEAVLITIGEPGDLQQPASLVDYDFDGSADLLAPMRNGSDQWLELQTGMSFEVHQQQSLVMGSPLVSVFHNPNLSSLELVFDLSSDEFSGFTDIEITRYTGDDQQLSGGANAQILDAPVNFPVDPTGPETLCLLPVSVSNMNSPTILMLTVQLTNDQMPRRKPSFLLGCTIDNDGTSGIADGFLIQNSLGIWDPIPVQRLPGRVDIGIIGRQRTVPFQ